MEDNLRNPVALMLADTHQDKDNLTDVEDIFDQAFDQADELGLSEIKHLGDVFTNRTGQSLKILLSFRRIAEKAKKRKIKIIFIPGNHDKTDLESEESYLDIFHGYNPYIQVISRWHVEFEQGALHCYIPYFKENTKYVEVLEELKDEVEERLKDLHMDNIRDVPVYLYTHIAVNGVKNNDGSKIENQLKYAMFKVFDKVFIGHYHNASRIGKNIFYIGSGRPKDFGEDSNKGFTVLYDDGHHEQIQARFKKFVKVQIDLSVDERKDVLKLLAKHKNSEDHVRFIIKGTKEQFAKFEQDIVTIRKAGIDVKREDKGVLKAMEAAVVGGKITFNYTLIKRYFFEFCLKNKETIPPEKRAIGLKYLDIIKDK